MARPLLFKKPGGPAMDARWATAKLQKKLLSQGEDTLSDSELLSLVLTGAGMKVIRVPSCTELLREQEGLKNLSRCLPEELLGWPGMDLPRICLLKAVFELGKRLTTPKLPEKKPVSSSSDVAEWFRCRLQDQERECLFALLLDAKNRPIRSLRVAEGTWTSCLVDPRVVFSECLRRRASAVILVHNHPSGDPAPSREDLELTERLVRAGSIVGVRVLDHIIVGKNGTYSAADAGVLY
jgi:DNA repair protein RadC